MEILDSGFFIYTFAFYFVISFLFDSNIQIPLKKVCYKECESFGCEKRETGWK